MVSVLPDVLEENLRVVFCGTAAGTKSARIGAYYAGLGNQFWSVLHRVGLTPERFEPTRFRELAQHGIGLTDLAQNASGMDKVLKKTDFDRETFQQKILIHQPRVIAFNGKKAASVFFECGTGLVNYGLQSEMIGKSAIFVLPSTSAPARGFWDERHWQVLADYVKKFVES